MKQNNSNQSTRIIIASFPINTIVNDIPIRGLKIKDYMGFNVKLSSQRMKLFKHNLTCVACGLTAIIFKLDE